MVVMLTDAPSMTIASSSINLRAEIDTGRPTGPWDPHSPACHAEEDRDHDSFEIRLSGKINFGLLQ